jgi:hypothetical protein
MRMGSEICRSLSHEGKSFRSFAALLFGESSKGFKYAISNLDGDPYASRDRTLSGRAGTHGHVELY